MKELAEVLGRERLQLEFLLFKVLALQNLLRSGETRFLRWSIEEIRRASERVRQTELARARCVRALAREAGAPASEMSLGRLAQTAPEPWKTIFADHNEGFRRLGVEVDSAFVATGELADASGHAVGPLLRQAYRPAAPAATAAARHPLQTLTLP